MSSASRTRETSGSAAATSSGSAGRTREIVRRTDDGIPYLAIEAVLLFKAKHTRDKDEADFTGVLPLLSRAERGWLDATLGLVHPDHPWRTRLRSC